MDTPKENFSIEELQEALEHDPEEVLLRLRSHEGKLLSLEDPARFDALRRAAEAKALEVRLARSTEKLAKQDRYAFVTLCAERVLPIFEELHPEDKTPHRALETLRAYVDGTLKLDVMKQRCEELLDPLLGDQVTPAAYKDTAGDIVDAIYDAFANELEKGEWPNSVSERVAIIVADHNVSPDRKDWDPRYVAERREHLAIARRLISKALARHEE
jgi:hypothetical protein